jgi:Icc-related predicted phosphoesterase
MKIAVTSDIHLEFGEWYPSNPENADVLILSGDIMVAADVDRIDSLRGEMYKQFLQNAKKEYKHVLYVMGNHEHYHGDFAKTASVLRTLCDDEGVVLLDKDCVTIEDVTFIGGTLWTDMNNEDPLTLYHISQMMNDFRCVKNSNRKLSKKVPIYKKDDDGNFITDEKGMFIQERMEFREYEASFSPENAVEDHKKYLGYIRSVIEGNFDKKYVVLGHHAPSKMSTHPRYKHDTTMNGGYSSSLDEFIMDHPQIKLWTHGHTHELFDYLIGSTRIVCNPRGYVNYERGSDMEDPYLAKVVEV